MRGPPKGLIFEAPYMLLLYDDVVVFAHTSHRRLSGRLLLSCLHPLFIYSSVQWGPRVHTVPYMGMSLPEIMFLIFPNVNENVVQPILILRVQFNVISSVFAYR